MTVVNQYEQRKEYLESAKDKYFSDNGHHNTLHIADHPTLDPANHVSKYRLLYPT